LDTLWRSIEGTSVSIDEAYDERTAKSSWGGQCTLRRSFELTAEIEPVNAVVEEANVDNLFKYHGVSVSNTPTIACKVAGRALARSASEISGSQRK